MAKPDWGELQQRFLSDHASIGISPKDWCDAQGLNYANARRYIKKPAAQSAQKPAQKEMSADELVESELTPQQKRFIAEYLIDQNATAAAARAGYSDLNYERQLLTISNIAQAIARQQKASLVCTLASADKCCRRCGSTQRSTLTSFHNIVVVRAVTHSQTAVSFPASRWQQCRCLYWKDPLPLRDGK